MRDVDTPFALKYIESLLLRQGRYKIKFIDCIATGQGWIDIMERIESNSPAILIIHTFIHERNVILGYLKELKKNNPRTVVIGIGPDATAQPDKYIFDKSPFDSLIMGECESVILHLIESLRGGTEQKIPGVYTKNHRSDLILETDHLDELPFPVYDKEDLRRYRLFYPVRFCKKIVWGHVLSSRGCRHGCVFCSQMIRQTYGRKIRTRSADSVVQEIRYLLSLGCNMISFCDDNFSSDRRHVAAICTALIKSGLQVNWSAQVRVDEVDAALLHMMGRAGCIHLRFGIESASIKVLDALHKTSDAGSWLVRALDAFHECRNVGIDTVALVILGGPQETEEDIRLTSEFIKKLNPDFLQLHYFTPYPGSVVYQENSFHFADMDPEQYPFHYRCHGKTLSGIDEKILEKAFDSIYLDFYIRAGFVIKNLRKFCFFYLCNFEILIALLRQLLKLGRVK